MAACTFTGAIAPEQQVMGIGHAAFELLVFGFGIQQEANFATDEFFCFFDEFEEVRLVDFIAYDEQVDHGAVFANGEVAGDKYVGDMSQALDHIDYNLIQADVFQ